MLKPSGIRHTYRCLLLALTTLGVAVLELPARLLAIDMAPPNSAAYFQTSGPRTTLGTGDFYTNIAGANNALGHSVEVVIPCAWPAGKSVTFAVFDPEVALPNQPSAPIIEDEVRDGDNNELESPPAAVASHADNTQFTLLTPGGATVGPVTFTPQGGSNLRWVELATINPNAAGYGCGAYTVRATTGNGGTSTRFNNDDNAWRLRVLSDPDCTVTPGTCTGIGAAQSARIGNDAWIDDLDGQPGTGDEIIVGMNDVSFQHTALTGASCLDTYEFVDGLVSPVRFHNFDMDKEISPANVSITYFPPSASGYAPSVPGVPSETAAWNPPPAGAFPNPPRQGDAFAVDEDDIGWWRIRTCVQNDNQYIVEGQLGEPSYFTQPPTPHMVLSKTDGEMLVQTGQVLTYTMIFTNVSHLAPPAPPVPGPAVNLVLTDTLPLDLTYVSCDLDAPLTGVCAFNGATPGAVIYRINNTLKPGEGGVLHLVARVNDYDGNLTNPIVNRATLVYRDPLKNTYPPVRAIVSNPTSISLVSFGARWTGKDVRISWRTGLEDNTQGFHLLRSTAMEVGQAIHVTPSLIPPLGASTNYGWTDHTVTPGTNYYYWLEEHVIGGGVNLYGPVSPGGDAAPSYELFLPIICR